MTQYEKVKVESFEEHILQNLRNDISKYLTANLPFSNLNVRNWYKHRQLGATDN